MSKRKDRKRYNNGSRQDYTKGGRVGYQEGGAYEFDDGLRNIRNGQYYDPVAAAKAQQAAEDPRQHAAGHRRPRLTGRHARGRERRDRSVPVGSPRH